MTDGIIVIIIIIATKKKSSRRKEEGKVKLTTSPPFFGLNEYGLQKDQGGKRETTAIDYDVIFFGLLFSSFLRFFKLVEAAKHTTFSAFLGLNEYGLQKDAAEQQRDDSYNMFDSSAASSSLPMKSFKDYCFSTFHSFIATTKSSSHFSIAMARST